MPNLTSEGFFFQAIENTYRAIILGIKDENLYGAGESLYELGVDLNQLSDRKISVGSIDQQLKHLLNIGLFKEGDPKPVYVTHGKDVGTYLNTNDGIEIKYLVNYFLNHLPEDLCLEDIFGIPDNFRGQAELVGKLLYELNKAEEHYLMPLENALKIDDNRNLYRQLERMEKSEFLIYDKPRNNKNSYTFLGGNRIVTFDEYKQKFSKSPDYACFETVQKKMIESGKKVFSEKELMEMSGLKVGQLTGLVSDLVSVGQLAYEYESAICRVQLTGKGKKIAKVFAEVYNALLGNLKLPQDCLREDVSKNMLTNYHTFRFSTKK